MIKRLIVANIVLLSCISTFGQQPRYRIDWSVSPIGGGIGQSTNYRVAGTAGQSIVGITSSEGHIVQKGFWVGFGNLLEYFPGDANMRVGIWPPQRIGGDLTYLLNYLRSEEFCPACLLANPWGSPFQGKLFYAAADINGDCQITGSDLTRLINYFRGLNSISWCGDPSNDIYIPPERKMSFPPLWRSTEAFPDQRPPHWPPCEVPFAGSAKLSDGGIKLSTK